MNNTPLKKEPAVLLPQANDFRRGVDLLTVLSGMDVITQEEMSSRYAFVGHQAHYYSAAARYLGIVEETRNELGQVAYALTTWGKKLAKQNPRARNLALAQRILAFETFRKTLEQWLNTGIVPTNQNVEVWIQASTPRLKSQTTRERRAQTIRGWVKWIVELVESDD